MRLNDRAKSLLSFHLPVVDFRVLLGSSGKKYTGSFTTYQLQTTHWFTYSRARTNQYVSCGDVVMKYPMILQSLNRADHVSRYRADAVKIENCTFIAKKIFQRGIGHKLVANKS